MANFKYHLEKISFIPSVVLECFLALGQQSNNPCLQTAQVQTHFCICCLSTFAIPWNWSGRQRNKDKSNNTRKSSLLLLSCFILGYYKCGLSFSPKNPSAGTLHLNNYKVIRCPKGTVPVNIFLIQCTYSWSRNGATCVSSTSFGPKSAPKQIFGVKLLKGTHDEGRLTPTTRGACPHDEGRLPHHGDSPRGRDGVPRGGGWWPLWWGVRRPSRWGHLNILPQIWILGHYLTPKKHDLPLAISN